MAAKSEWCGVSVDTERSLAAVKSWFSPHCDDAEIVSARILSDVRTDATKKVEIVVSDNGRKRRVTRTFRAGGNYSITFYPFEN